MEATTKTTTITTETIPTASTSIVTKRPKARHCPYPILLSGDRRSRKRKSIKVSWQPDEKIHKVHYFEYIADERVNVTRINNNDQLNDANASGNNKLSLNAAGNKISNAFVDPISRSVSERCIEYVSPWPALVLIDFTPELPSPGWNSIERSAQAERESYVLGAIDLPGQPSTLDEPGPNASNTSEPSNHCTIIPSESTEGIITEYPDMYITTMTNSIYQFNLWSAEFQWNKVQTSATNNPL